MSILELLQRQGFAFRKVGTGEWAGACPFCGGDDRFRVWPEDEGGGRFWCRRCEKSGDSIGFLRLQGMSFRDACAVVGRNPGSERRQSHRTTPTLPGSKRWIPREAVFPSGLWVQRASAFLGYCHSELMARPEILRWLAGERGIEFGTVKRFRLGWNPIDVFRTREAWGLPAELREDGKPRHVWLPAGLVIPAFSGGSLIRLRVRRPQGDPRYVCVSGSSMAPMVCGTAGPVVIVESELDGILISSSVDDVIAVALGSVSNRPDKATAAMIQASSTVLVALDYDLAGAKEARGFWRENFPLSCRWPVPAGKDPTEYFFAGGNIAHWIAAGCAKFQKGNNQ